MDIVGRFSGVSNSGHHDVGVLLQDTKSDAKTRRSSAHESVGHAMNAREFFSEILKSADETCELFAGELVDLKWLYCTEGLVAIGINLALWFVLCPFAF